ncbi:MAG: hypothetical protein EOP11_11380 [Proteobacteria bacterium]|nr:MAG: hypothetical protein EOP11_11380 [Pseudomonadota bacterium]
MLKLRPVIVLIFLSVLGAGAFGFLERARMREAIGYWQPVRSLDFESGNFSGWQTFRLSSPEAAKIVSSPVRHGAHAAAITLHPNGRYGDAFKSELSDPYHAPFGETVWYRLSHYLAPSFDLPADNYCVLAQWHSVSPGDAVSGAKPPLALRYAQEKIKVTVSFSRKAFRDPEQITTTPIYETDFARGQWHDFVYRVVFAGNDSGRVDLWHNGKKVANYAGPVGYPGDPMGPYFKTGMYCLRDPAHPLTAYVDEYRRGKTSSDVLLPGETLEGE